MTSARAGLRDFRPHLRAERGPIVVALVVSFLATLAAVSQPITVQALLGSVSPSSAPKGALIALLVAVTVTEALLSGLQVYLLQMSGERLVFSIREALLRRLLALRIVEYDRRRVGDLVSRVSSDSAALRSLITSGFIESVSGVLMFVLSALLMSFIDLGLLLLVLAMLSVGASAVFILTRLIRGRSAKLLGTIGAMSTATLRSLSAIRTIRAASATQREADRVVDAARDARDGGMHLIRVSSAVQPLASLFIQGSLVLILVLGGIRVGQGVMAFPELVAFILYWGLLVQPVSLVIGAVAQVQASLAAMDRISEIVDLPVEAVEGLRPSEGVSDPSVPVLEFADVSFTYENGTLALDHVSLAIKRGSFVGIVGPSGSGKSSLLALLERFYEPDSGEIRLDGIPIHSLDTTLMRHRMAFIEQGAPTVTGTIAENVKLTANHATSEQMMDALALVGLGGAFSDRLNGLESPTGDGSGLISGGERQRLAWARVLLADAEVLLLDEPTSAVDNETESLLVEHLVSKRHQNSTVVMVSHRLPAVQTADQILVLEGGRVVGVGTHTELLASSRTYRQLARHL